MSNDRVYSEAEIALLLQRSAQLQADDTRADKTSKRGLTLTELEDVASGSGLDPEYLQRAALEMELSNGKSSIPKKTNTHIYTERFFSGQLTDEAWEEIVFELRGRYESASADLYGSTTVGKGITEQIDKSREWRITSFSGIKTSVLFRPKKTALESNLVSALAVEAP